MRIAFMGTSEFAVPSLDALLMSEHKVVGVWTRPDKPHGRGHKVDASPVKQRVLDANGIVLFQPPTLKHPQWQADVDSVRSDVVCVAAYGLILPPSVLESPRFGCVNVHASILPRYRGAAPIHRAVIAGEKEIGVTTMQMDEGLDTGDILLVDRMNLGEGETTGEAQERLAVRGAALLLDTLRLLERGECPRVAQDSNSATYAPPLRKEECEVNWRWSAQRVHNLVRGVNPRPGAFTVRNRDMLKIHRTAVVTEFVRGVSEAPGRICRIESRRNPVVCCGVDLVELLVVQPAGKRTMSGHDYLLGKPLTGEERLTFPDRKDN